MTEPRDWREERIQAANDGRNPTVLAELSAAYAVIGDVQFLPGYSLALTKTPGVDRLSDLPRAERLRYLADVDLLADAVETVCRRLDRDFRRLNIEILGNTDAFLHCHIWPRYEWEPPEIVGRPVWLYDPGHWQAPATALGPAHDGLRAALTSEVVARRDSEEFQEASRHRHG
ncbi:diadenosine tetraphosphate hydrolase [Nocardioides sp. 503]|uniref:HIT family protein n=1 Tax=Nocardioides sp. 503 TaxID=2508326 RepID=UPI0010700BB4|nr:diadenosine tetraphosphate hydrolase [Nocardioides sp. 503]